MQQCNINTRWRAFCTESPIGVSYDSSHVGPQAFGVPHCLFASSAHRVRRRRCRRRWRPGVSILGPTNVSRRRAGLPEGRCWNLEVGRLKNSPVGTPSSFTFVLVFVRKILLFQLLKYEMFPAFTFTFYLKEKLRTVNSATVLT